MSVKWVFQGHVFYQQVSHDSVFDSFSNVPLMSKTLKLLIGVVAPAQHTQSSPPLFAKLLGRKLNNDAWTPKCTPLPIGDVSPSLLKINAYCGSNTTPFWSHNKQGSGIHRIVPCFVYPGRFALVIAGGIPQHAARRNHRRGEEKNKTKHKESFDFWGGWSIPKQQPKDNNNTSLVERVVSRWSVFCQNDKQPHIHEPPAPRSLRRDGGRRR